MNRGKRRSQIGPSRSPNQDQTLALTLRFLLPQAPEALNNCLHGTHTRRVDLLLHKSSAQLSSPWSRVDVAIFNCKLVHDFVIGIATKSLYDATFFSSWHGGLAKLLRMDVNAFY